MHLHNLLFLFLKMKLSLFNSSLSSLTGILLTIFGIIPGVYCILIYSHFELIILA